LRAISERLLGLGKNKAGDEKIRQLHERRMGEQLVATAEHIIEFMEANPESFHEKSVLLGMRLERAMRTAAERAIDADWLCKLGFNSRHRNPTRNRDGHETKTAALDAREKSKPQAGTKPANRAATKDEQRAICRRVDELVLSGQGRGLAIHITIKEWEQKAVVVWLVDVEKWYLNYVLESALPKIEDLLSQGVPLNSAISTVAQQFVEAGRTDRTSDVWRYVDNYCRSRIR
jgi:hypothetical protein